MSLQGRHEKSLKGRIARLSVICIQKNNWHGKRQLVFSEAVPGRPADDFSNGRACFADPERIEQGVL